jgi:hypothetical protein
VLPSCLSATSPALLTVRVIPIAPARRVKEAEVTVPIFAATRWCPLASLPRSRRRACQPAPDLLSSRNVVPAAAVQVPPGETLSNVAARTLVALRPTARAAAPW